jgi:putative tricarboxylic transport membrane protein
MLTNQEKGGKSMLQGKWTGMVAACGILLCLALPSQAQEGWRPDGTVELIVGTGPGSGFDRMARELQRIGQETKLLDFTTTVVNKPGGNTAAGFVYLNQHEGDGRYIGVMSPVLLTNNLSGANPLSYKDLVPLSIMVREEIAMAVSSESSIKSGTEFLDRLKKDPTSVSIGLSGVGGQNHLTVGLVAQTAGVDITKLKIVGFDGSSDVVTAVLGGHVDVIVAPVSTIAPQLEAGTMRVLGVASAERLGGIFADTPTWREQGVDTVFANWRGFVAPSGTPPEQVAFWNDVMSKLSATQQWQDEMKKSWLTPDYLDAEKTKVFLDGENAKLKGVLQALGLVPN